MAVYNRRSDEALAFTRFRRRVRARTADVIDLVHNEILSAAVDEFDRARLEDKTCGLELLDDAGIDRLFLSAALKLFGGRTLEAPVSSR